MRNGTVTSIRLECLTLLVIPGSIGPTNLPQPAYTDLYTGTILASIPVPYTDPGQCRGACEPSAHSEGLHRTVNCQGGVLPSGGQPDQGPGAPRSAKMRDSVDRKPEFKGSGRYFDKNISCIVRSTVFTGSGFLALVLPWIP